MERNGRITADGSVWQPMIIVLRRASAATAEALTDGLRCKASKCCRSKPRCKDCPARKKKRSAGVLAGSGRRGGRAAA